MNPYDDPYYQQLYAELLAKQRQNAKPLPLGNPFLVPQRYEPQNYTVTSPVEPTPEKDSQDGFIAWANWAFRH